MFDELACLQPGCQGPVELQMQAYFQTAPGLEHDQRVATPDELASGRCLVVRFNLNEAFLSCRLLKGEGTDRGPLTADKLACLQSQQMPGSQAEH